jgi:pimeloyl-ACP methyl ester carboxylesterase
MPSFSEASTSRYVEVGGLKLHYNDAGDGPVVIMLHGAGPGASGWSNFSRNIRPFVEKGFRVILLDLPGFNKSVPTVTAMPRFLLNAQAVKGLMDVLGIERAHLVGNSMGGGSSLAFALEFPERLHRMVLMGPAGLGPSLMQALPMEGIKLLFALYRQPNMENLQRMLRVFIYDQSLLSEDLIQQRYDNMMAIPEHLSNFLKCMELNHIASTDYSLRLSEIQAETLVTWGRDDRFVPLDWGLKLLWGMPNAQLHIFNRCGHWAQWERANEFNPLALDFLQD